MVSQKNWSKKPSQTKLKTGKTYRRKDWNDDYGDNTIENVSKMGDLIKAQIESQK